MSKQPAKTNDALRLLEVPLVRGAIYASAATRMQDGNDAAAHMLLIAKQIEALFPGLSNLKLGVIAPAVKKLEEVITASVKIDPTSEAPLRTAQPVKPRMMASTLG